MAVNFLATVQYFNNDLDVETEGKVVKSADNINLRRAASNWEDRIRIQNNLDKLEDCSEITTM